MRDQGNGRSSTKQEERSKRQERAERILDAAAGLIQRWGYNKTTIDDIAKQAGVAKGTIYLHWKTREDLFRALIIHEEAKLIEDIKQHVASDSEGTTLHGVIKHSIFATLKRPIWKAVMLRDTDMLGELARREASNTQSQERIESFKTYFEFLRSHGLVRTDIGIQEQIYMLEAISLGFLLAEPFLPDEFKFPDEVVAEMTGETIRRTFELREPATANEVQEGSRAFKQYFDRSVEIIKAQDQKEME